MIAVSPHRTRLLRMDIVATEMYALGADVTCKLNVVVDQQRNAEAAARSSRRCACVYLV